MTYLELLVLMQEMLKKAHMNPEIAYEIIIYHDPTIHSKEELIDARNEVVTQPNIFLHDLDQIINHHVPLSRITHQARFYGLNFDVDHGVFAPRPETELLVEEVIKYIDNLDHQRAKIIDLGCGTGVISITLSHLLGKSEVECIGIDQNPLAIQNATRNNVKIGANVQFICGDMIHFLANQPDHSIDIIVSNPPYIAADDQEVENSAKNWDPNEALYAKNDGLYFYEAICRIAGRILRQNGLIAFEIGHQQGSAIQKICSLYLPDFKIRILQDYNHKDRIALLERIANV